MKSAKALPRYGSGHKSAGRTDGRTDGQPDGLTDGQRQNNIPPPLAGDNNMKDLIQHFYKYKHLQAINTAESINLKNL
ncbi:hypothetical protein DPMN_087936 [Dreissena polymorpha]|uniref:Uncharacterized protein n=1 Tax=Dreissena polymorpha TaxID=45954 RepID=A0A9D4QW22_DREPO|nr:hypothetical protein DPMN_087936 [Dreissena polymorpha]